MYLPANLPLGRLLGRTRWLPVTAVLLLVLLLSGGLLLAAANAFLDARNPTIALPLRITLYASAGVVLLTPALVGAFAALHTGHYMRTETYQLLRLTDLSRLTLVRFHVTLVLHRLRLLLALAAALTPVFLVSMMHRTMLRAFVIYPGYPVGRHWIPLPPPLSKLPAWRLDMLGWTPELAGWSVGLWGVSLLALVLGVGLTLRWRHVAIAAPAAALTALILPAVLLAPTILLPVERWSEGERAVLVVALALAPYLLALAAMRLVRRWA